MIDGTSVIVGNFEVSVTLTDKRTIKMSGYVYNGETPEEINQALDLVNDALDRQQVRYDVVNKESQIESITQNLEVHRDHFNELVEKRNKAGKLTSQEKQMIDKYDSDVRGAVRSVESLKAAVAAGRKKLNGSANVDGR
jgi:hypothetical protein